MWSGSVLPGAPDGYGGTGIELLQDSSSFLRFRTSGSTSDPAGLEAVTPTFFLGSEDAGNYISGSNGNIEITSSNFWLQPDGDVIMQGTITAEAGGTIGGFAIGSDTLTATNFTLNTTDKRLTLGNSNDIFIADADEGIKSK